MLITAKKKKLPSGQQVDCCLTPQLDNLACSSRHVKLATKIRGFAFIFFRGKDSRIHDWHIISSARFEYQWKDACMHAQLLSHVWLCDPMDCSPQDSSIHGILPARILEQVAISSSRGFSWLRDRTWISRTGRQILYYCTTWEAQRKDGWASN